MPLYSPIPSNLLQRILSLRGILTKQGSVIRRCEKGRAESFRLRYRVHSDDGKTVQVAVDLGQDEGVSEAVRKTIRAWRRQRHKRPVKQSPKCKLLAILDEAKGMFDHEIS